MNEEDWEELREAVDPATLGLLDTIAAYEKEPGYNIMARFLKERALQYKTENPIPWITIKPMDFPR